MGSDVKGDALRGAAIEGEGKPTGESAIEVRDALIALPACRWSVVPSNPLSATGRRS